MRNAEQLFDYPQDFEQLNSFKPSLETIKQLKEEEVIPTRSPYWWSTDYAPDPREYISHAEFRRRLIRAGEISRYIDTGKFVSESVVKPVDLYPYSTVPMTVTHASIRGQELPFFVTARPYHKKEEDSFPPFSRESPSKLKQRVTEGSLLDHLPLHFLPHIRGLFAGVRGSHMFWYPINPQAAMQIQSRYDVYTPNGELTYSSVYEELYRHKGLIDTKKPQQIGFPHTQVSVEEFLHNYTQPDTNLAVMYPLRMPDLEQTLPLVVASKTHTNSSVHKPAVLGIYSITDSRSWRGGIWRVRDKDFARQISEGVSKDLGTTIDTVLYTPRKGSPKYERVSF